MPDRITTQVGGRRLTVTHLDKALWPEFTKAQVLDYYLRVADVLIPHARHRPASFLRTPAGTTGPHFFAHQTPERLPDWVSTTEGKRYTQIALDDPQTLIAVVNHYCLEIHTPQWSADTTRERHDRLVFDLDPGDGADLATCCRVAHMVRARVAADGLTGYPMTTGGKGLHIYVALTPPWLADDAVDYARQVARELTAEHRTLITHVRGDSARTGGKVLVDWAQNHTRATTSAPYSLRVRDLTPGVSTPLTWDEVETGDPGALDFTPADVLDRVERHGDLAAGLHQA